MELNCCIIDDEPLALELMESYVVKTPFLRLAGKFSSALEAMEKVCWKDIDLIFLDIQMPELSGMEFSRILGEQVRIVFTTAFERYAVDSYKVNALDYLLKPISYPDFLQSANKALQWYELLKRPAEEHSLKSIFVKTDYKLLQVELANIQYVEGLKDYVKIYLCNEPHPLVSLMSMKALEDLLPTAEFMRVHRSYIVRKDKIEAIERNRIVIRKQYLPVSDSYKEKFTEFLNEKSGK